MTLDAIARKAGVSKGSVSKILNGTATFSHETTEKVNSLLKKSGHTSLIRRKTIIVATHATPSALHSINSGEMLGAMLDAAKINKLQLEFKFIKTEIGQPPAVSDFEAILAHRPVAMILDVNYTWDGWESQIFALLEKARFPILQVGIDNQWPNLSSLVFDSYEGTLAGLHKLIAQGHRRIATLRWQFSKENKQVLPRNSEKKHQAYKDALRSANIGLREDYIKTLFHLEDGFKHGCTKQMVLEMLNLKEPPTAVFVENAICCLPLIFPSAQDHGRLPAEFYRTHFICFEDERMQQEIHSLQNNFGYKIPNLTFISPNYSRLGTDAIGEISNLFKNKFSAKKTNSTLLPEIVEMQQSAHAILRP